jgi:3-oxoacyl-[acyl-carrier-protein] synthase II
MMTNNAKKRVVVTGVGWLTPLGCDIESAWLAMLAGKSGIKSLTHLDDKTLRTSICGLVSGYKADEHFSSKEIRKLDPFIQYALVSSRLAINHSGIPVDEIGHDMGVAFGSGIGGLSYIENNHKVALEQNARRISPFFIPSTIINMAAGNISIEHGLKGPNISVVTACASGTHNIGMAARMIAAGDATAMIAGGSEFASGVLGMGGFSSMKALSTRNDAPEKASRPWDKDRDGFVLSDGAGSMVLEDYEYAKARGANILAEIVGFKMAADAFHMTSPDKNGGGAIRSMAGAIKDAGIDVADVDVINAHGTSTQAGDLIESNAIKEVFKEHAYNLKVSSIKSMLGHTLGASGAIEGIASVLTLRDQMVPPTINCENPAEGCDLDYVRFGAEKSQVNYVLSNSFGFGGTNGSVLFKKYVK